MLTKEISEVEKELDKREQTFEHISDTNFDVQCQVLRAKLSTLKSAQAKFDKFVEDLIGEIGDLEFDLDPDEMRPEDIWGLIDKLSSKQEEKE
jgi:hypothetical protein